MAGLSHKCRIDERWGVLYLEHAQLCCEQSAVVCKRKSETTVLPAERLCAVQLGPGVSITDSAVRALADQGCLLCWTGREGGRMHAHGAGPKSSERLLHQVGLYSVPTSRLGVARRLLERRLGRSLSNRAGLDVLRGVEGRWVRELYQAQSQRTGVEWEGRQDDAWDECDAVNRALSVANAFLYALCHSAILAAGYSPAVGFLHTGDMRSFVYDMADLYKPETAIPLAFDMAAAGEDNVEKRTRGACPAVFHGAKLPQRIIPDIEEVLNLACDDCPQCA